MAIPSFPVFLLTAKQWNRRRTTTALSIYYPNIANIWRNGMAHAFDSAYAQVLEQNPPT